MRPLYVGVLLCGVTVPILNIALCASNMQSVGTERGARSFLAFNALYSSYSNDLSLLPQRSSEVTQRMRKF